MRKHPWLSAAIIFFVLCVVVFFTFEWRAEKRWQRYAADARARGVKLLLTDFERPSIPDEINFAKLPMFQKASADGRAERPLELPQKKDARRAPLGHRDFPPNTIPLFGDPLKLQPMDWPKWQQYFWEAGYLDEKSEDPVRDVLRALDHYTPEIQQWREWHTRTQCQFPVDWSKGVEVALPHLGTFQHAVKTFALRMRAHLALHDSAAAYQDFQDGLQAYRALREEPNMINGLVRMSLVFVLLGGVGDGCKDHAWSDEDGLKIEEDLAAIRVWDDWQFTLASERGGSNTTVEQWLGLPIRERGKKFAAIRSLGFEQPSQAEAWIAGLYPRGMIRDNQLRENRLCDELLARVDIPRQTLHLDGATPSLIGTPADSFEQLHYFLILMSQRVYIDLERRYVTLQIKLDQARLACALERFRTKRGLYPAALSELVPDFIAAIPTDIDAGAPYHYRRIGDATFLLYGVGKNRQDDGGSIAPGVPENKQLDAVWLYAPASPAR